MKINSHPFQEQLHMGKIFFGLDNFEIILNKSNFVEAKGRGSGQIGLLPGNFGEVSSQIQIEPIQLPVEDEAALSVDVRTISRLLEFPSPKGRPK